MGFGYGTAYRNSGINRLDNYADALRWFENTKPIRGREVECRPLGHRNRPHFSISKDADGAVVCHDYNPTHRTVVFKPNGEVVIKPHWVSTSTSAFIYEVTGISAQVYDHGILLSLGEGHFRVPKEGITVKREHGDHGFYKVVGEVKTFVHQVKRKEANNVRLMYEDVRNYVTGMFKVRVNERNYIEVNHAEVKEVIGFRKETSSYEHDGQTHSYTHEVLDAPRFELHKPECMHWLLGLLKSDEPDDQFKGFVYLCKSTGGWRTYELDLLRTLDRVILSAHKDEVFKVVEVARGTYKKDRYGWAFE